MSGSIVADRTLCRESRRERTREVRERSTAVASTIMRLNKLGIRDAKYLLRGWRKEDLSPVEVYERSVRLLERHIKSPSVVAEVS